MSDTREHKLAELLAQLSDRARGGTEPDVAEVAADRPDLVEELRQLWATVRLVDALSPRDPRETVDFRPASPVTPARLDKSLGDYELLEELGRGGMGVVYKARQKSLNRTVALKMILRGAQASAQDQARFRVEAEAAGRLDHSGIVPVYEVGSIDGTEFFSMKYVEGTTLARRIAEGPIPSREAARLVSSVARAVHHAHEHKLLHRDIKPSNVLIDRDGHPHVTDFGLAKRVEAAESLTTTGAIVGTPTYMAPEQAAGSRGVVSPASDIYSLGVVLYEMLTGRPPFLAGTAMDTIMLVLEQEPLPPRMLNARVDRDLEWICLKCLQKPPDLRYPNAAKLADDLDSYLRGDPTTARPSGLSYFMGRMFRETHQAAVLESWGVLWMWHSLALLILCWATAGLQWSGFTTALPYLSLWVVGLGIWATILWRLRQARGPVTFVERQIAHVWAASTMASMGLFVVEMLLHLPVLTLSPILAIFAGMIFVVKAGMLSGSFYVTAAALFLTAGFMAAFPTYGLVLFGIVSALSFFVPGLKYSGLIAPARRP